MVCPHIVQVFCISWIQTFHSAGRIVEIEYLIFSGLSGAAGKDKQAKR